MRRFESEGAASVVCYIYVCYIWIIGEWSSKLFYASYVLFVYDCFCGALSRFDLTIARKYVRRGVYFLKVEILP